MLRSGPHPGRAPGPRTKIAITAGVIVGVAAIVQPAFASTNVRGLWHMNETGGTTMFDSSGYGNNGTLSNVKVGLAGYKNKAYGFNGTSSIVSVPHNASLDPGTQNVTWTIHIKFTKLPGHDYDLFRKGTSAETGVYFKSEIASSGQAICWVKGTTAVGKITAGPNLANGRWHTITCKKTGSAVTLVVDGASYTVKKKTGSVANTGPLTIGAKAAGDWTNGVLDEAVLKIG